MFPRNTISPKYGYVLIAHEEGLASLYGHLSSVSVAVGQHVLAGKRLGLSGGEPDTNGAGVYSTGPHLHFEIMRYGARIDPVAFLHEHAYTPE